MFREEWDNLWESRGDSMVNVLGRFPRVLNVPPEGEDWRSLKRFSKGKPETTSKARPKAKNLRGRMSQGFLAFGLAEDVAEGLPLENPEGVHRVPVY